MPSLKRDDRTRYYSIQAVQPAWQHAVQIVMNAKQIKHA